MTTGVQLGDVFFAKRRKKKLRCEFESQNLLPEVYVLRKRCRCWAMLGRKIDEKNNIKEDHANSPSHRELTLRHRHARASRENYHGPQGACDAQHINHSR